MKILYVGDTYDYLMPERGFGYGYYNCYPCLRQMDGGRHQVVYFPLDELFLRAGRDAKERVNANLLEVVDQERPDLTFFIIGMGEMEDIIQKETLQTLRKGGKTITVTWMSDDQWSFETYSKRLAPYFNWVITTDYKAPAKYRAIGYQNVIKSQWGYNPLLYKPLNLPKIYDVSFVGRKHGNREEIVERIKKAGIEVHCWGPGWQEGYVSQEKMLEIFSQSRICLNFSKSAGVLWKELAFLFARRRIYDRKILWNDLRRIRDGIKTFSACMWNDQIKIRNFEIPACGSFCLTEYANDIESYFEIGREIDCFSDVQGAVEKIRYYLDHEQEREAIAKAGYERALREHTWEKRFHDVFNDMGLNA